MCTHKDLRKYAVFKNSVKRVLNFINYQIETSRPSSLSAVPVSTSVQKVGMWLDSIDPENDGSSQRSQGRQYWDERDTKSIKDAFEEYIACPKKGEIRRVFMGDDRLY